METNVNSKSQDRFIFKFSRYFTHYLYRTNIEIHEARDKKKLLALIILMLGAKKWPNFKFSIFSTFTLYAKKNELIAIFKTSYLHDFYFFFFKSEQVSFSFSFFLIPKFIFLI